MGRVNARASRLGGVAACALGLVTLEARAEDQSTAHSRSEPIVLFADVDDDDDDGVRDADAPRLRGRGAAGVLWLNDAVPHDAPSDSAVVRLVPSKGAGLVLPSMRRGQVGLQGLTAGTAHLAVGARMLDLYVLEVLALDARGERVDLARSHAAISRELPDFLADRGAPAMDPDALRWVLVGPAQAMPDSVALSARRPDGSELDQLGTIALGPLTCPAGVRAGLQCRATELVRATGDRIDRGHPESAARSLRAEVGGRIVLSVDGRKAASIRVGGPRRTALGAIERLRARLRIHVLRSAPGGMPSLGGDDAGALALAQAEIDAASGLWGQCGIHFGEPREAEIFVRDPPPSHLLTLGCELGLPASGGEIRFVVGGRRVRFVTRPGMTPTAVATELSGALTRLGFAAGVSPNPRTGVAATRTADLLVRLRDGALAQIEADGNVPISSDPTLGACLGEVDLADGLTHFADANAPAGTLEERTLIKAYADGDATTIDVFIVPAFTGSGRIGESFVDTEGASIQNVIVLDRAGVRAGARSAALAHEIGHVLLDMPGHPDDYGVDSSSALMDADATDPSIFGPRRLSVAECERAVRQSGAGAPIPLLTPWPMTSAVRKP